MGSSTDKLTRPASALNGLMREAEFITALLEHAGDGVVACDANGDLALFNQTSRDWHGMDAMTLPPEQWSSRYDLFHADGVTPLATEDIPLFRAFSGEQVRSAGMVIARHGHPPRHIEAEGRPIFSATGEKIGAVVVMHDITERANAHKALEAHADLLAQRVRDLSELAYATSHDLSEPLRGIRGHLDQVQLDALPEDVAQAIKLSRDEAARMQALMQGLLQYVQLDQHPLQPQNTTIGALLDQAFRDLGLSPEDPRIRRLADTLPLRADPTVLAQALRCGLDNALKFHAPNQAGEVEITADRDETGITIHIRDGGVGIEPKRAARAFRIFQRLHPRTLFPGHGIGLAKVMRAAQLHGGSADLTNNPGPGATLSIRIPQGRRATPT